MSLNYRLTEHLLHFKQPAGTSRGVYTTRQIWMIHLSDGTKEGIGECAPLPDLSCDACPDYADILDKVCADFCQKGEIDYEALRPYPSMLFGLETALLDLQRGETLFDTAFSRGEVGIPINGLVWMGNYEEMLQRMEDKLEKGFRCVKLKIGAIDFEQELELLKKIRNRFSHREIELRVDANGAFAYEEALDKLELLSHYALHSIEQPIKAGQWAHLAKLCRNAPLPIALDEELIGVNDPAQKRQLLTTIRPAYIVLKPSLHGGMQGCREWIDFARKMDIGSWITSALESNVGLHAIAQFTSAVYGDAIRMPQGLGTGQLFTDNFPSTMEIRKDCLWQCR